MHLNSFKDELVVWFPPLSVTVEDLSRYRGPLISPLHQHTISSDVQYKPQTTLTYRPHQVLKGFLSQTSFKSRDRISKDSLYPCPLGVWTSTCYSVLDWIFLIQPHSDGLEGHRGKEGGLWGIIPKWDFLIYPQDETMHFFLSIVVFGTKKYGTNI
jgi:hypothetical protein